MNNPLIQMMLQRLQQKNPMGYNVVSQAMQNNGNPSDIIQQMFKNASPEQRQNVLSQAKNYGVPENILAKIQNIK